MFLVFVKETSDIQYEIHLDGNISNIKVKKPLTCTIRYPLYTVPICTDCWNRHWTRHSEPQSFQVRTCIRRTGRLERTCCYHSRDWPGRACSPADTWSLCTGRGTDRRKSDRWLYTSLHSNKDGRNKLRLKSKIEKVPRGIQGENSNKDTACSGNLVSQK